MSYYGDSGSGAFGSAEEDTSNSYYTGLPKDTKKKKKSATASVAAAAPSPPPTQSRSPPAVSLSSPPELSPPAAPTEAQRVTTSCPSAQRISAVGDDDKGLNENDEDCSPLPRQPTSSVRSSSRTPRPSPLLPQKVSDVVSGSVKELTEAASSPTTWCSPVQVLPNTIHSSRFEGQRNVAAAVPDGFKEKRETCVAESEKVAPPMPLVASPSPASTPPMLEDPLAMDELRRPPEMDVSLDALGSAERRSVTVTEHPLLPESSMHPLDGDMKGGNHSRHHAVHDSASTSTPRKPLHPMFSTDLDSPSRAGEEMKEWRSDDPSLRRGLAVLLAGGSAPSHPQQQQQQRVPSAAVTDASAAASSASVVLSSTAREVQTSADMAEKHAASSPVVAVVAAAPASPAHPTPYPVTSTSSLADWSSAPRLGFAAPSGHGAAAAEAESSLRRDQEERKREDKWYRLCRGVSLLASASPEAIVRLRGAAREYGIPHHLRGVMWLTLTGMALKVDENEYFCAKLLRRNGYVTGPNADAIAADVQRTFPGHPYFSERDVGIYKLTNVLHALCWRNPLLSYCQSFNFLAAFLLLVLDDEERVFWLLLHIFEQLLPNDFYGETLLGANVEQAVLERLVKQRLPRVAAKFNAAGLQVHTLVANWMMSMFVNIFPPSTALRLWDYLFCRTPNPGERTPAHLEITLAVLKYLEEKNFLVGEDAGELLMALRDQTACLYDAAAIIRIANTFAITPDELHQLRREAKPAVVQRLKARESARATEQEKRLAQELQYAKKAEAAAAAATASAKNGV